MCVFTFFATVSVRFFLFLFLSLPNVDEAKLNLIYLLLLHSHTAKVS